MQERYQVDVMEDHLHEHIKIGGRIPPIIVDGGDYQTVEKPGRATGLNIPVSTDYSSIAVDTEDDWVEVRTMGIRYRKLAD